MSSIFKALLLALLPSKARNCAFACLLAAPTVVLFGRVIGKCPFNNCMSVIFTSPIRLFRLIKGKGIEQGKKVAIRVIQNPDFNTVFEMSESTTGEILVHADVNSALNVQYRTCDLIVFFDLRYKKKLYNLSMVFFSQREFSGFIDAFTRTVFEHTMQRRANRSDEEELERFREYMSLDRPDETLSSEATFGNDTYETVGHGFDNGKNEILKMGDHIGNAIVLRKYRNRCDLGLFALDRDCTFRMALNGIKADERCILVDDIMLHDSDRTLLMLDSDDRSHIHLLNMGRGAVVDFVDAERDGVQHEISHFIPTEDDSTFLTFNRQNTFLFDPRASHGIVNMSEYKSNCKFTCGASTRHGRLAMGSENGVVRLYHGPCKSRATVTFQVNVGGDPIIGLDISPDEQWVLATCPYYISVFNVYAPSTGKLGFDAGMGKDKPPLTRLTITGEHQQLVANCFDGELPPFSPAKFDIKNGKAVAIVAAIGTCLVTWDFRRIERNSHPRYCLKLVGGEAVVDDHPFAVTSDIMFISENQVSVVDRK